MKRGGGLTLDGGDLIVCTLPALLHTLLQLHVFVRGGGALKILWQKGFLDIWAPFSVSAVCMSGLRIPCT